jgi:hypothetical protein
MKLLLLFIAVTAQAQTGGVRVPGSYTTYGPTLTFNIVGNPQPSIKTRDPQRMVGNMLWQINGESITNGWVRFYGKVAGVQSGGIRVRGSYTGFYAGYEDGADFFVANFPYEVADGDSIGFDDKNGQMLAKVAGVYTYATAIGGSRTIKKLDYGEIYTPPAPPPLTPEQIAAKKAAVEKNKKAVEASTVKWLRAQADSGDAFSQYRLGERYLRGNGVETNAVKAREYLTKASAQGNADARELLQKLPAQESVQKE